MPRRRVSVIEAGHPGADPFDSLFRLVVLVPLSVSSYLDVRGYDV